MMVRREVRPRSPGPNGTRVVVTCEHGGNRVPTRYAPMFEGARGALAGHRGWDPGALTLARQLAESLDAPLRYSLTTRLLVDVNRPLGSPTLFSEFSAGLGREARRHVIRAYHLRHWRRVTRTIESQLRQGDRLLHIGVHTFTPTFDGSARTVDVGVLFDPARALERILASEWVEDLSTRLPELRVRSNEPYLGTDEGLTTELRRRFPPNDYIGLELEVSQALVAPDPKVGRSIARRVAEGVSRIAEIRMGDVPDRESVPVRDRSSHAGIPPGRSRAPE